MLSQTSKLGGCPGSNTSSPSCPVSSSKGLDCTLCETDSDMIMDSVCSREQGPIPASASDGAVATETALAEARGLFPDEPVFAQRRHAAFSLAQKGMLRESIDQYDAAIAEYDALIERLGGMKQSPVSHAEAAAAAAADPAAALAIDTYADFLPFCLNEAGILLTRHGRVCDAVGYFDRAMQHLCHAIKFGDARGNFRERNSCLLMETKKHMACALKSAGEYKFACKLFLQLMDVYRCCAFYGSNLLLSDCAYHVAEMLNSEGLFTEAEPVIRECVAIRREIFGGCDAEKVISTPPSVKDQCANGKCPSGKTAEMDQICSSKQKATTKACRSEGTSATETSLALCLLAATIASPIIGKYDEAEAAVEEALLIANQSSSKEEGSGETNEVTAMHLMLQSIRQARAQQQSTTAGTQDQDLDDTMNDDDFAAMMDDDDLVDIDADM